jgi:hypothetical protein
VKTEHLYCREEKLRWWGQGEWLDEPDIVEFEHLGFTCKVLRVCLEDGRDLKHRFGGFLNGYVAIPSDHPFYQKAYEKIPINCHGGLTFGECTDRHLIGFDCAHSFDYIPSTEHLKKTIPSLIKIEKELEGLKKNSMFKDSPIFQKTYRNMEFVIAECKKIAEQLK